MGIRSRIVDWLLDDASTAIKAGGAPPETTGGQILGATTGTSSYNTKTIKNYAQNGFMLNTTVYRAVSIVAQACASVDWLVYKIGTGKKKQRTVIDNHPLSYLLAHPNKERARSTFIEQMVSYWMIAGENYVLGSFGNGSGNTYRNGMYPIGIYNLRPDLVTLHGDSAGNVAFYRYDLGSYHIDYPAWKILPLRFFHPLDELAGLSPIAVAAAVIERQNAGEEWNFHLMKNMARPSGAFVAATEFSDDARMRLKREILNKYGRGKQTAGMPMLLENGLSYVQLAMNPVDADWFNSDSAAGRKIASAIGVDPLLLQDKQYSTYNNELEAKLAMWELTCFPLMEKLKDELNAWLTPFFGIDIEIDYDREPIESLKRNRQMESVTTIAEWNTGLRSFNDSSIDLALETVADKDDFYRFGPTTFVRKSDIGKFLDAQKLIWNAPPPMLGGPGRSVTPIGGPANPSVGNSNLNAVPRNPVPLLHEPANLNDMRRQHSVKDDQEMVYHAIEKDREQWYGHMTNSVVQFFQNEVLLVLQAIHSQTVPATAKSSALNTVSLHGSQLQALLAEYYGSIASDAARHVGQQFGTKCSVFTKQGLGTLGNYAGTTIQAILTTTQKNVEAIFVDGEVEQLSVDQIAQRIRALYQGYKAKRAETIALNEAVTAYNAGSYIAASQLGMPLYKIWLSSNSEDGASRHTHMHGKVTYFEEAFDLGGQQMLFPKDGTMGASTDQLVNCRCGLMYMQDYHPEENPYHQNYMAQLVAPSL